MTPLDTALLGEARTARDHLLELQRDLEKARADYNHAVRRLHAEGGSLREIAEDLGLSHQRVHQIVEGGEAGTGRGGSRRRFGWAFERFTRRTRRVVVLAQEEAAELGHGRVGTEHLLLGLVRAEDEVVAPVLAESGITLEPLRALVAALDPGPRRRSPFSRAAKRALEQSLREAQALGDRFIGAEHVLLGLVADERAGSLALVRELGADPEKLRAAVLARRAAG
jgi:hypothetical protein